MILDTTRQKIKTAASEEFIKKGYDGARMQEIADRAGANKAMIYYYFRSKGTLFESIIREAFEDLFEMLSNIDHSENIRLEELIPKIIHVHMKFLSEHPHLPKMIVREINSGNPITERVLKEHFKNIKNKKMFELIDLIEKSVNLKKLRKVDPQQTIWNVIALNLFFFIAKPILNIIWPKTSIDESKLLKRREKAVVDLLLYGLLPRK